MFAKNKKLLQLISSHYKTDLSGVVLIACQHILGTTVDLLEQLFSDGLKPSNTFLIGKCYSTNLATFRKIRKMHVNIDDNSLAFNSTQSFDEQFKNYINNFCHESLKYLRELKSNKKIIVLDDGGQLISNFNDLENFDFNKVVAVEQTSSGFEKISRLNLNFPVINIARSKTKLVFESPIIADVVTKEIQNLFKRLKIKKPNILVVGDGYIGKNIARLLSRRFNVDSYDQISHNKPFPGDIKDEIKKFDVIIGTTGNTIISANDFNILKHNSFLISASSSDREFSAWEIRKQLPQNNNCHQDIYGNGLVIANGGFPINFTGRKHSAPPNKIFLTRSLLLAGVLEASTNNYTKGVVDLPEDIQRTIVNNFQA